MNGTELSKCEELGYGPPQPLTQLAKVVAVILYSLTTVLAIGGNSAIVFIIIKFKRLRTPTNLLILNLAVADLLMAVLCIPLTYWPILIIGYWPFGQVACILVHFAQICSVMLSSYTLVAISIDRFLALMFPLHAGMRLDSHQKALAVIALVWLISIGISTPILFVQRTVLDMNGYTQCEEQGFTPEQLYYFGICLLFLQYLIPLAVLIITYSITVYRLWFMETPGSKEDGNSSIATMRRNSIKKMIPMMITISFLYAACWLPQNLLMNVLTTTVECLLDSRHIFYIYWAVHLCAMSHSFVNPPIYCARNSKFRAGFAYVFRFLPSIDYKNKYSRELVANHAYSTARTVAVKDGSRMSNGLSPGQKERTYQMLNNNDVHSAEKLNTVMVMESTSSNSVVYRPNKTVPLAPIKRHNKSADPAVKYSSGSSTDDNTTSLSEKEKSQISDTMHANGNTANSCTAKLLVQQRDI